MLEVEHRNLRVQGAALVARVCEVATASLADIGVWHQTHSSCRLRTDIGRTAQLRGPGATPARQEQHPAATPVHVAWHPWRLRGARGRRSLAVSGVGTGTRSTPACSDVSAAGAGCTRGQHGRRWVSERKRQRRRRRKQVESRAKATAGGRPSTRAFRERRRRGNVCWLCFAGAHPPRQ